MAIPKIIHYCWFGQHDKPTDIKEYMETWKFHLSDYKFVEWNESNVDININSYVKNAYQNKKYAFVADYFRLKALYDHGGIYLDTDVEIKKNCDDLLENSVFLGFIFDCSLGTAVIGAKKQHMLIKNLLHYYEKTKIVESFYNNNDLFTKFFLDNFSAFRLNGKYQRLEGGITIYPKEYFERPAYKKSIEYAIHHCKGSWRDNPEPGLCKKWIKIILGKVLWSKLSHYKAVRRCPFYEIYLKDKNR